MLLQTNSYIVPAEQREAHAELLERFRRVLTRLGCENFEAYEQTGANWTDAEKTGRFIQIMRFKDREQQVGVQTAEREDAEAQQLIAEFCDLINFPYQQQHGFFAVGFYSDEKGSPAEAPPAMRIAGGEDDAELDGLPQGEELTDPADEYAEKELDALIAEFGAPDMRQTLEELERAPMPPAHPDRSPDSAAADDQRPSSGSGFGAVLDAGLLDEELELEIPMPAELLDDESEEPEPVNPARRPRSSRRGTESA